MTIPSTQMAVQVRPTSKSDPFANLSVATGNPVPSPGEGEVLVRMKLRPINPVDVFSCLLLFPGFKPQSFPATPGYEGVGVVMALGAGVTKLQVGQRVMSLRWSNFSGGQGCWQEYVTCAEAALIPVPDDISDEAAACMVNAPCALGLLKKLGPVPEGEYVIITAAGSAVGRLLIGLCKYRDIKTIAVVRRRALESELKALGATEVVVTPDDDLVQRVSDLTGGKGARGALDCLCGDMVNTLAKCCGINGQVILYGSMLDIHFSCSAVDTYLRQVSITGYSWPIDLMTMSPEDRAMRVAECWELFRKGVFTPHVGTTYSLEKVMDALKEHFTPGRPGKVFLSSA